jgi:type IV pilus assembly protein PilB
MGHANNLSHEVTIPNTSADKTLMVYTKGMSQDARRDEEVATQRRAHMLGFNYVDTSQMAEHPLFRDVLSMATLYDSRVIPLHIDKGTILFGITTTTSQQTIKKLESDFLDKKVSFAIISETGYRDYLKLYDPPKQITYQDIDFRGTTEVNAALEETISATLDQVRADDMLAYLVQQAHRLKASDIHLESQKEYVRIRFRVDGVLHVIAKLKVEKYRQLISAIAIAANVSTASEEPQAGHINQAYTLVTGDTVTVNMRVETINAIHGMDVVMRLFNLKMELLSLDKLNLSKREREVVDDVINHPSGMVLVVGPTGSGKTTTMYSLLNTLNTEERKILTIEDPVEYFLDGVTQIPVIGKTTSTGFAERLRSILRLDPDIVMIGEIRDQDTARTALQAALTGHLVMSTFHASSSAAALTRMLDYIGINPLFSSAIRLIMAQRLVRRLDDATKQPYRPDETTITRLKEVVDSLPAGVERPNMDTITLYRAGTSAENPFGYAGQIPLREQLQMTQGVQQLLKLPVGQVTTEMLEAKAIEDGMVTMLQDGVLKIIRGETTVEEVYRVVG